MARLYGGIEAGGTHWNCAVGDGESTELVAEGSFATTSPAETLARAAGTVIRQVASPGSGVVDSTQERPGEPSGEPTATTSRVRR